MTNDIDVQLVPAMTHGRVLVRPARAATQRGLLVGFHGYMENAAIQMTRLQEIPGASAWTLVSIQGLHRFYRGRTEEVVASWMTREDRDLAIADNLAYVATALDAVPYDESTPLLFAGFSQGVAMALRAGVLGRDRAAGMIGIGGDVPPELLADRSIRFPPLLLARGARDEWFTQAKFDADVAALTARDAPIQPLVYEGAHEWNGSVSIAVGEFLTLAGR